jgi:hypothetical protein
VCQEFFALCAERRILAFSGSRRLGEVFLYIGLYEKQISIWYIYPIYMHCSHVARRHRRHRSIYTKPCRSLPSTPFPRGYEQISKSVVAIEAIPLIRPARRRNRHLSFHLQGRRASTAWCPLSQNQVIILKSRKI